MPEFITLNPFACIGWIIIGVVAGGVARQLTGSKDEPWVNDLVLGLLGSMVGGLVAGFLGINQWETGLGGFIANFVVSIVGAVIIIVAGRFLSGRGLAKR
jgi:uncharacterized membrane protein YeaQ/YmgE (transglycosylase-associated protein family)